MEKKIIVPDGMQIAFDHAMNRGNDTDYCLEAALRWLSENPIVPTREQYLSLLDAWADVQESSVFDWLPAEWQRRMFLAPEPTCPREVLDLMYQTASGVPVVLHESSVSVADAVNDRIVEAYRRGQKAGK